jgi:glycine/D-amino acid oxidase-like deaminating enzyme
MSTSQRVVIIGAGIVGTNLADEVRIALELQNWH